MAVPEIISSAPPRRFSLALRVVIALLAFLLFLLVIVDVWFYRAVKAALPAVDGTMQLAGLAGPVMVTRDSLGVPSISAGTLHDLFFAQGYVTAQDRLWQMDMTRRFASGDLAEVLGPDYVKVDVEQRILGLRQVAEKVVVNIEPAERERFQAYADGVNAYIAQHQKTLPLEFRFMMSFPYAWTVEDSVMVGLSMTEYLNHYTYRRELQREKILARLGPELTADLYVNSSWRDHPPGSEGQSIENEPPADESPENEEQEPATKQKSSTQPKISSGPSILPDFLHRDLRPGSNNWVVSGAHTVTGKPMLSNDMHLDLRMPNTWYEATLPRASTTLWELRCRVCPTSSWAIISALPGASPISGRVLKTCTWRSSTTAASTLGRTAGNSRSTAKRSFASRESRT